MWLGASTALKGRGVKCFCYCTGVREGRGREGLSRSYKMQGKCMCEWTMELSGTAICRDMTKRVKKEIQV